MKQAPNLPATVYIACAVDERGVLTVEGAFSTYGAADSAVRLYTESSPHLHKETYVILERRLNHAYNYLPSSHAPSR